MIVYVCGFENQIQWIECGCIIIIEFDQFYNDKIVLFKDVLYDCMIEYFMIEELDFNIMFVESEFVFLEVVDIFVEGWDLVQVFNEYNKVCGLVLDQFEVEYLVEQFIKLGCFFYDIEFFMFVQVNLEYCCYKQFNVNWIIDGIIKEYSLFGMIRNIYKVIFDFIVLVYSDNVVVIQGENVNLWVFDYFIGFWKLNKEFIYVFVKVEIYNYLIVIVFFFGVVIGFGGEICDEGVVGRGFMFKVGFCGFWVFDLYIFEYKVFWEIDVGCFVYYVSSFDIMLEVFIGSVWFNNEFGCLCLIGIFRIFFIVDDIKVEGEFCGYYKFIMIVGGVGIVREKYVFKDFKDVQEGVYVIVFGGFVMLIGLGGGVVFSNVFGEGNVDFDFDSVQCGNFEMECCVQMVINICVVFGDYNFIVMIYDVGVGGFLNVLFEFVKDVGFGGRFEFCQVECVDCGMSFFQIWCNEVQECYVILVNSDGMECFIVICSKFDLFFRVVLCF